MTPSPCQRHGLYPHDIGLCQRDHPALDQGCDFTVARLLGDAHVQGPSQTIKLAILRWALHDYCQFHSDSPVDILSGS
jgi:hypothetical protein